jgi:hypothetical protein
MASVRSFCIVSARVTEDEYSRGGEVVERKDNAETQSALRIRREEKEFNTEFAESTEKSKRE